ncbi:hypothetical protein QR680_002175 [Steinernema hermaphroditum]|uniref:FAD dependent oxidoreductase domain-containing protein n=1 Tax=Steinernema hermaphroditum TaxID=289476 RepID=A0AA39H3R6_9BILA|nr:hypothetical protein QR680_002175 [Steinernema hermaphroditum]
MQSGERHFDAIVIGAGIMGSCTAYQLSKAGVKTLLVEQFPRGHSKGSSHGASRIIRYAHTSPIYLPLAKDAYEEWDKLAEESGKTLYRSCGMLWLSDRASTLERAKILKQYNVEHEVLTGKQISERYPHLSYDDNWFGLLDKRGGVSYADRCLEAAQERFMKRGGVLKFGEEVLNIVHGELVQVVTSGGVYSTKRLVVTAGGWLNQLLPNLPVKTEAHHIGVNFWNVKGNYDFFKPENNSPTLIINDGVDELFMIPNVDYDGKAKFGIHLGVPIHPSRPLKTPPEWMHSISAKHITEHIPDLDASSVPAIRDTCLYTMTHDNDFIIDRHPDYDNVFIGGGFSGTGFKFSLTVGKILTRMVLGLSNDTFDLTPFKATRKIDPNVKACL